MMAGTPGALPQPPTTASFLGQGISYPPTFDPSTGRLKLSNGPQSVLDAINSIASTQVGERPLQPDYGADAGTFEPIDPGRLQAQLDKCIQDHEARVEQVTVKARAQPTASEQVVDIETKIIGVANPLVLTYPQFLPPA